MKKLVFAFLCISLILASPGKKGEKKKGSGAARVKVEAYKGSDRCSRKYDPGSCRRCGGKWYPENLKTGEGAHCSYH